MQQVEILGQSIRSERNALGLSQTELGEISGVGLNFISQLERGKPTVRLDKVLQILRVLGLELHVRRGKQVLSSSKALATESEQ